MPPGNVAFLLALPVLMEERGKIWSTWAKVVSVDLICKTFFFSSPMRAFEETSQQGGGGALEVAGGQRIDWQGQRI